MKDTETRTLGVESGEAHKGPEKLAEVAVHARLPLLLLGRLPRPVQGHRCSLSRVH